MSTDFWAALALMMVLEGVLPFARPEGWRQLMLKISRMTDAQLRTFGFLSMVAGVLILYGVRRYG